MDNNLPPNDTGTKVSIRRYINTDSRVFIEETICFCRENSEYVLENLIEKFNVEIYNNISIIDSDILDGISAIVIDHIDMDNFKGMILTGSIHDFIDTEYRKFEICKRIGKFDIDIFKDSIDDLNINLAFMPKEQVYEVRDTLTDIYNKLKFKMEFGNVSVIIPYK